MCSLLININRYIRFMLIRMTLNMEIFNQLLEYQTQGQ